MKFLKQVKYEIVNILRSRFLLVMGIIVLAFSVLGPVIGMFTSIFNGGGVIVRPMPMEKFYATYAIGGKDGGAIGQDPITVGDVTITSDNPLYWEIKSIQDQKGSLEINKNQFTKPEALDLVQNILDEEINLALRFAVKVTKPQDYRMELYYNSKQSLYDKFIYDHKDADRDALIEAVGYRMGLDAETFRKKYFDITAEEQQKVYQTADEALNRVYSVVDNNDFSLYIDLRIEQSNQQIADLQANIAEQEKLIVENPGQEDIINQTIEQLKQQIQMLEKNTIPILEFRREKHIVPGEDIWQNTALMEKENSQNQLIYMTIVTEDKFNQDQGLLQQYGTYQKYKTTMQRQIDQLNNQVLVADKSLKADKPDMKYVASGARSKTVAFLDYSVFVALFGVMLGGWLIASEYQQGTIRLLMIRPKTRVKILMAKFTGALLLSLAVYVVGSLLNVLANGIFFGFGDYVFPNYSINGEQGFFAYYLPKMLLCLVPIVFGFSMAFLLSVLVKNSAVAIAVPIVCFVGCFIASSMILVYPNAMGWLAYTPIPYVRLSAFFAQQSEVLQAIQNGAALSVPLGIGMLLVLSVACVFGSILIFRKRDITN